jgi:hypothetical protein
MSSFAKIWLPAQASMIQGSLVTIARSVAAPQAFTEASPTSFPIAGCMSLPTGSL